MENKVLFVATVDSHINHFHLPFLKMFKEKGYKTYVASNGDSEFENVDEKINVPFERYPFKKQNYLSYKQLKKLIEENNYEIIHCHTPVGGVITRLAGRKARKRGTKIFYTAHGFHFYKGSPLIYWLIFYPIERFLARFTDALITINEEDYSNAKKFKAKKVYKINGVGIDVNKFQANSSQNTENSRKSLNLEATDFVITGIGELNGNKNHILLIQACEKLIKSHKNIKVLIAGEGNLKLELEKEIDRRNLKGKIRLIGFRKDIPEILAISNLLISTSKREGLPVNIMEAMATGLPVIATDCRGNRDLVQNEINGYLVPFEADIIAEKISLLYENKKLCEVMGKKSVELVAEFSLEKVMKEMEKIYYE